MADTQLGKLAEEIIIQTLSFYKINNYFSYDLIRINDFKNHAPFDGIITNNFSAEVKNTINEGVKNFGTKLNTEIRQKLRSLGVSTVEIKSTRISDKYKQKNNSN